MGDEIEIVGICEECDWYGFVTITHPRSKADILNQISSAHASRRMFCDGSFNNGSLSVGAVLEGSLEGIPETHMPTAEEVRRTNFFSELFRPTQHLEK